MEEIIENGYNLNIPRYVDSSEEEEEVDILQVKSRAGRHTQQVAIDKVNSTMKLLGL